MEELKGSAIGKICAANSSEELLSIRRDYLGKKSFIASQFAKIPSMPVEERKAFASLLNGCSRDIKTALAEKEEELSAREERRAMLSDGIDVTLPVRPKALGCGHPISNMVKMIRLLLSAMGMSFVDGPEIENEYYAFDALNVPKNHPAREMQDTIYLKGGGLLRPHTSSVQIRVLEKADFPLSIFSIGKVYRDDDDASHTPMFHQVEGLHVGEEVDMAYLKGFIERFICSILGNVKVRFRPSFFPFTTPSAEVDVFFCSEWVEILGCGIVHPNVLNRFTSHRGFAFGIGIERLAMIKYGISDLRKFFFPKLGWLRHYGSSNLF